MAPKFPTLTGHRVAKSQRILNFFAVVYAKIRIIEIFLLGALYCNSSFNVEAMLNPTC